MISPCQLGGMSRPPLVMPMSAEQKAVLETWIQAHGTPQQVVLRCRIVMGKAAGVGDADLAQQLKINRHTCRLWRRRFVAGGPESLWAVATGRGRKPQLGLAQKIVEATVKSKPAGQTHWSTRTMAKTQGVAPSTVCRIWQEHGLQPHRQETFKLSRDPQFVPKLLDVVGVYLHPPQNAVVLCVDEKSQIQALDRTAPILPLRPGLPERRSHDYVRHGTTTLFAALEIATGKVTGACKPRHRNTEFIRFLNHLERQLPGDQEVHLILDNYCTHKRAEVQRWL